MKALHVAVQKQQFDPAYYLHGEEEFRKEEALRYLVDGAVDPSTRDFNLDQRKGSELNAEAVGSLLGMPPMMAERRVVVIRDVTSLKKDARAVLEKYLESPSPDLLLVLTAPADAKADKTLGRLATNVECEALSGAQVPKWIVARVEKNFGRQITPEAASLLHDAVGSDLSHLAMEIEKLASYCREGVIDENAVAETVGVRREDTLGALLDAIALRDANRALTLMPGVLQQPKMSAVFVVMTLTTQMLALAVGKARNARSSNDFFNILRSGSSNLTGRSWGDAAAAWARALPKWSAPDLDHALEVLLQTDLGLKNSRVSSEDQLLATAILGICGGAPIRNAA
ncbi:MAG TPA: DNA polymerase III subunit delta [Gemmatimonadaceae bacterium]|nr:DNA polymerase III subunit delta [Gemmatimonadaceae bacterium]